MPLIHKGCGGLIVKGCCMKCGADNIPAPRTEKGK
jgi:hypothetical protein